MFTEKLRKLEKRKQAAKDRKEFIINELFDLDPEIYLDQPLYKLNLAQLENVYIAEKCRSVHAFAYKQGVTR